jgi:hypothetical protein
MCEESCSSSYCTQIRQATFHTLQNIVICSSVIMLLLRPFLYVNETVFSKANPPLHKDDCFGTKREGEGTCYSTDFAFTVFSLSQR